MENEGYQKIVDLMNKTYLIVDPGIIKLMCAAVVANRLPIDPVWLFLVTGSSGGKTAFLNALLKVKGMVEISSLTPNTFLSGMKKADKETSLLKATKDNDIFIFKDFTSLLTMQKDARSEVMGQLREIYDGSMTKRYGNGITETWQGRRGFIAAVTSAIYTSKRSYAAMGERFIIYSFLQPDPIAVAERAMDNIANIDMNARRLEIQDLFHEYLDEQITIPKTPPKLPKALRTELIELANLATQARSAVERDWASSKKEMELIHAREMPTRFATQLSGLGSSMMILNGGELLNEDKNILYKIALDSIDQSRRIVLQTLTQYQTAETAGVAAKLNYPTDTTRRWLEDLNALGLIHRRKATKGQGNADKWELRPQPRAILEKFEGIHMLSADLVESNAVEADPMEVAQQETAVQAALEVFGGEVVDDGAPLPQEPLI